MWGHGYGKEAVSSVIKEYAPELVKLGYQVNGKDFISVTATARADNEASVKILKSVGMRATREEVRYGYNRHIFFVEMKKLCNEPINIVDIKGPNFK